MEQLKCGFAQEKITPEYGGIYLDGYGFRLTPAVGVRDDLYVKACAFENAGERFLMLQFDLIGFSEEVYKIILPQIESLTGLEHNRIALCSIHTHAGPACGVLKELPLNYDYLGWVGEQAGRAGARAFSRLEPGAFDFRISNQALIHSHNRRGRTPIDRRIFIAPFVTKAGKVSGTLCSASCHAVINTTFEVSADYLSVLNTASTDDCPLIFLQGRAADINPCASENLTCDEFVEQLGLELLQPVTDAVADAKPQSCISGEFKSFYEYIKIPMKPYPSEPELRATIKSLEAQYFSLPYGQPEKHYIFRELRWHRVMLERLLCGVPSELNVPMQLFAAGHDFVFAYVPFELLTLTGSKLEEMFTSQGFLSERVYIIGYCNSVNGYLAPVEEFEFGGYEVSGASHWYLLPECSEESEAAVLDWFDKKIKML
jgi:Neutral/alkaline non-lysosomal ceramidase.